MTGELRTHLEAVRGQLASAQRELAERSAREHAELAALDGELERNQLALAEARRFHPRRTTSYSTVVLNRP